MKNARHITNIIVCCSIMAISFGYLPLSINYLSIQAQTKTPTITPTPTVTPSPNDEKFQEIRQTIKELSAQIKNKMEKRSFVGTVKEITSDIVIVTNFRGQQRIITDETTIFLSSSSKEIKLKDLAVGDKIIALGFSSNDDELQAVRISVTAPPKTVTPGRTALIGQITQIDTAKSTISFANEGTDASTKTYKIDKNSKYSPAPGSTLKTLTAKLATTDQRAVLIYQEINKVFTVKSLLYLE